MAFVMIKGTFRLLGKTKKGNPTGFKPDGDSIQFKPANAKLLDKLTELVRPYRLSSIGSTQLRFEGIDALELHFSGGPGGMTHQPRPLADDGRDYLVTEAGLDPVAYRPPETLQVVPPVPNDGSKGYILARSLEVHGRPVAFVFAGSASEKDGSEYSLRHCACSRVSNYQLIASGNAYPLFYDTLFYDLRNTLAAAAGAARNGGKSVWARDRTRTGTQAGSLAQLESHAVVFPKLFRRLAEFIVTEGKPVGQFPAWVAATRERVLDLDTTNNTHFDTFIQIKDGKASLTKDPERLVFVSAKRQEPWV